MIPLAQRRPDRLRALMHSRGHRSNAALARAAWPDIETRCGEMRVSRMLAGTGRRDQWWTDVAAVLGVDPGYFTAPEPK